MTVITFDDNLITGNKTIDEQHKELIDRIQQFVSACESEDARVKAIKMLDYLDEYTEFHFKEEEKLQKDVDYPGLEEHIKKHEEFRHTVKELYDYLDENEGPDEKFMEQVKINVIDWLFGHIKTFDRSVAEYINIYDNPDRLQNCLLRNYILIMYAPVRQNTFCKAADILADKCGCDVIARFETNRDAVEGDNLIKLQKRYSDECYVSEYLFL